MSEPRTARVNYFTFGTAYYAHCVTCAEETIHTRLTCCHCKTQLKPKIEALDENTRRVLAARRYKSKRETAA